MAAAIKHVYLVMYVYELCKVHVLESDWSVGRRGKLAIDCFVQREVDCLGRVERSRGKLK